jgi:hypothetical protein
LLSTPETGRFGRGPPRLLVAKLPATEFFERFSSSSSVRGSRRLCARD